MKATLFVMAAIMLPLAACQKDEVRTIDKNYKPDVSPAKFTNSTTVTNPYFHFKTGTTYVYEGQTEEGFEHNEIKLLNSTREVMGIMCIVVNDKVWLNDKLIEDTQDWFAQDNEGNVWYFGETVDNFNPDGSLKDHDGSWEAGVDGAQPGIMMPANPEVGMTYREEYYFNEAEDQAAIEEVGLTITVPYGTFTNCIKTRNWTELERGIIENKYYASGFGLISETNVSEKTEIKLVGVK